MEMEPENEGKIKYLVADTTAFINAVPLNQYALNVLTVPDVVAEVRNKRQIRRLCVLPFDLQVREPKAECVKHCVEFAKKTGDYASLSGIDIKVVALTYELELEHVGGAHLRNEPVMSQVIASRNKPEELQDNTKLAGWYNPKDGEESDDDDEEEEEEDDQDDGEEGSEEEQEDGVDKVKAAIERQLAGDDEDEEPYNDQDDVTDEMLEHIFEKLKCNTDDADDLLVPECKTNDDTENAQDEETTANGTNTPADAEDDGEWITPTNIKKVKKAFDGKVEEEAIPIVGCMSTDYAVQNVIKQLNLNLTALNGRVIKHLRTYILRCYSCYKTTSVMTKIFCPKCGNKTLKRVAVSLDENGKQVIHINTRRPLTAKYKNQSLPRFRGGKHSHNPILFEDQPIPRQMPSRVAKTKTNALDEDYTAGFSPFMKRDVDSKSAMLRSKGHLKEWARNNAYEEERRKKHYNRLYK